MGRGLESFLVHIEFRRATLDSRPMCSVRPSVSFPSSFRTTPPIPLEQVSNPLCRALEALKLPKTTSTQQSATNRLLAKLRELARRA